METRTAIGQEFPDPSAISGDHVLRAAPADTPFQQVIYEDHLRTVAGVPAWLLTIAGALALTATTATVVAVRRSGQRRSAYWEASPDRTEGTGE